MSGFCAVVPQLLTLQLPSLLFTTASKEGELTSARYGVEEEWILIDVRDMCYMKTKTATALDKVLLKYVYMKGLQHMHIR